MSRHGKRTGRLGELMQEGGYDAFLASSAATMGYLTGFAESGHERLLLLAVSKEGVLRLICPALSATQAARAGIGDIRSWRDGEDPIAHVAQLAVDWKLKSGVILVDDEMPAAILLALQEALPAALFKTGGQHLPVLLAVKDAGELDQLRQAARIADRAFETARPKFRVGMSERELAELVCEAMREHGGRPTFCIVATGANGAEPHHESDETRVSTGDVTILDFGCEVGNGYNSDITRVVAFGEPEPEAKQAYRIVHEAFLAGCAAAKPGAFAGDVDAAARAVIEEKGYGPMFVHRTGHGIGTRVHEAPYIVSGSSEELKIGHCFSVEPGIYLPNRFGIRIENIVTIVEGGCESLNAAPSSELIEVL